MDHEIASCQSRNYHPLETARTGGFSREDYFMKIEIEYCGRWGYEPRAREARELILKLRPSAQISLQRSSGGVFEIRIDGQLAFSKKATGSFPTSQDIADCLT